MQKMRLLLDKQDEKNLTLASSARVSMLRTFQAKYICCLLVEGDFCVQLHQLPIGFEPMIIEVNFSCFNHSAITTGKVQTSLFPRRLVDTLTLRQSVQVLRPLGDTLNCEFGEREACSAKFREVSKKGNCSLSSINLVKIQPNSLQNDTGPISMIKSISAARPKSRQCSLAQNVSFGLKSYGNSYSTHHLG